MCVIFVSSKAPTLRWLCEKAKPLIVRCEKIRAALHWLKEHNPLYKDVEISDTQLAALPCNDLLPVHVEHVLPSAAQDVLTSRYDSSSVADPDPDPALPPSARTIEHAEAEFSKVVVTDVDGHAPAKELWAAAVRHVKEKGGAYVEVPHGPCPVNEFCNPSLFPQIYPCLFPYGIGGFEDDRRVSPLGFQRHVRHVLALRDPRFREHHSFMFTAFNILQHRSILLHSSLKVCKSRFASVMADYASVSDAAVARVCARIASTHRVHAEDDEECRVLKLMNDVQLVTRQVPGSSGARLAMRNEVRALMYSKGMPSFFITINPADVYNPLIKFFTGGDIDVDNLLPGQEPDYWEQSILVTRNPVVAARFFHTYMSAFVKTLLKWDPSLPFPEAGVLGIVKAYYGCIEAQGRGTLHCHMLIWVEGGLNPTALQHKLQRTDGPEFGQKLLRYLEDLIHTSLPSTPSTFQPPETATKRPLTNRGFPLNLNSSEATDVRAIDLYNIVAACQQHSHSDTCYKYCDKRDPNKTCRFELDENNTTPLSSIDNATGIVVLQHLDRLVNNFNPTMIEAMRCNMDLKFIGSGDNAKALIFYITDYVTKSPLKAHVSYSALEHAMKKFHLVDDPADDIAEVAKRLLRKCAFSLTSNQELSAQQVASYLLGHSDNYTSHQFANLYWPSFERYVNQQMPSPKCFVYNNPIERPECSDNPTSESLDDDDAPERTDEDDEDGDDDNDAAPHYADVDLDEDDVTIGTADGGNLVMLTGQLSDYIYRGKQLEDVSLWDFVAQTTKAYASTVNAVPPNQDTISTDIRIDLQSCRGHNLQYVSFLPSHPEHAQKLLKVLWESNRRIPVPIGPRLPCRDHLSEWNKYCHLMLILFKPWRTATDLRAGYASWPAAYDAEFQHFHCGVKDVIANMQLLHECQDSRNNHMRNRDTITQAFRNRIHANREQTGNAHQYESDLNTLDEDDLLEHLDMISDTRMQQQRSTLAHTLECTDSLDEAGFYGHCGSDLHAEPLPSIDSILGLDTDRPPLESSWHAEYDTRRKEWKKLLIPPSLSGDFTQSSTDDS